MEILKKIKLSSFEDYRGDLVAIEENMDLPFSIRRIYYMFNLKPNEPRGFHAHKKTQQLAICLRGSCTMLIDNGHEKTKIEMKDPKNGVLIDRMVWHEMHNFSSDCLLLLLASELYDENDYIRDYEIFLNEIN